MLYHMFVQSISDEKFTMNFTPLGVIWAMLERYILYRLTS